MSNSTKAQPPPAVKQANGNVSATAVARPWILNAWQDMLFFVATPLLIIPLMVIVRGYLTVADIALYVISFGALGHHLPGMLRAYGDRELFARFRIRFIVAPLFLLAACGFFAHRNLNGLAVILLGWGAWHGAAQVYGFLRIYDAKVQSFSPWTAKLDLAMCVSWFALGIIQSPDRMGSILRALYDSGIPTLSASTVHLLQTGGTIVTVCVTSAFIANWIWQWSQGHPPSTAKLLLLVSCIGFWWYAMIFVNNIILGIAMFEIYHDVQYLAIVWVYNVKRVETGHRVGGFTHFLFRRSWLLVGLYVGLVFAYGCINLFAGNVNTEAVKLSLFGVVTASTFLHFYYDGFIWKVREKSTREGLGMRGGLSEQHAPALIPGWVRHGMKWSLFVAPITLLAMAEIRGVEAGLKRERAIVAAVPDSAIAHYELAAPLIEARKYDEALQHLQKAAAIQPDYLTSFNDKGAMTYFNLGQALQGLGRFTEAVEAYQNTVRIDPEFVKGHDHLAFVLQSLGRHQEAIQHFKEKIRIEPDAADGYMSLGLSLFAQGRTDEAIEQLRAALQINPKYADAHGNLGMALHSLGRFDEAVSHYQKAINANPDFANAHNNLARLWATFPDESRRDGQRALEHAKRAAELSGHKSYLILDTLAAAYAEVGDTEQAVRWQQQAIQIAPARSRPALNKRLEEYHSLDES